MALRTLAGADRPPFLRARPVIPTADAFLALVDDVATCRICPAMLGRTRVLTSANGSLSARVLFVAEAPGRLGADRLGVPLQGDRTGDNFEGLLRAARWRRDEVFVSNAVLCNPRDDSGRNRPPSGREVANCANHLARLIAILDPHFVVTLGAVALRAADLLESHDRSLSASVGKPFAWLGRILVPLYHPGPRALLHRPLQQQRRDYRALRRLIEGQEPPRNSARAPDSRPTPGN
jgi:uracil-DNA glycosylase family 4